MLGLEVEGFRIGSPLTFPRRFVLPNTPPLSAGAAVGKRASFLRHRVLVLCHSHIRSADPPPPGARYHLCDLANPTVTYDCLAVCVPFVCVPPTPPRSALGVICVGVR